MADRICSCGNTIEQSNMGPPRKHCATCKPPRDWRSGKQCNEPDCSGEVLGRGLCPTHYSQWHRRQLKYTILCPTCGEYAKVSRKKTKYCSHKCGMDAVNQANKGREPWNKGLVQLVQCKRCNQLHLNSTSAYCSDECKNDASVELAKSMRSPLRVAIEEKLYELVIPEIKRKVSIDQNGCWIWPHTKDGYPVLRSLSKTGKHSAVHRIVLEAKYGKPLGSQAAHHICAMTACVNPDHLQPVTHRENTAEMMQRRAYVTRIRELTDALAAIDPQHPVLNRIEVA